MPPRKYAGATRLPSPLLNRFLNPLLHRVDRERLKVYAPDSEEHARALGLFLARTDQKPALIKALARHIARLHSRRVFVNVGSGSGPLTQFLAPSFDRTVSVAIDGPDLPMADLILCSHVLYPADPATWIPIVERLLNRLSQTGLLAIVLQKRGSACMNLLERFAGKRPFLDDLLLQLRARHAHDLELRLETVHSTVRTGSLEDTVELTEFLLNLAGVREMPQKTSVIEAIAQNLVPCPVDGYSLSCDQDLLLIRR